MLASMRQSAQETPATIARSSAVRSEFALSLSRQPPARMIQFGPRSEASVRLKLSEKITVGGPASGGPASGGPASGGPASGGPASGGPASGVPPSGPPPEAPLVVTVKSSKKTPATSVHIPAVPAPAIADADASVAKIFAAPFT